MILRRELRLRLEGNTFWAMNQKLKLGRSDAKVVKNALWKIRNFLWTCATKIGSTELGSYEKSSKVIICCGCCAIRWDLELWSLLWNVCALTFGAEMIFVVLIGISFRKLNTICLLPVILKFFISFSTTACPCSEWLSSATVASHAYLVKPEHLEMAMHKFVKWCPQNATSP